MGSDGCRRECGMEASPAETVFLFYQPLALSGSRVARQYGGQLCTWVRCLCQRKGGPAEMCFIEVGFLFKAFARSSRRVAGHALPGVHNGAHRGSGAASK